MPHEASHDTMRILEKLCMLLPKLLKLRAIQEQLRSLPTALVVQNVHLQKSLGTFGLPIPAQSVRSEHPPEIGQLT